MGSFKLSTIIVPLIHAMDMALEDALLRGEDPQNRIEVQENKLRVYTRYASDWTKKFNGGDYDYWTTFTMGNGRVVITQNWSADFDARDYLGEPETVFADGVEPVDVLDLEAEVRSYLRFYCGEVSLGGE